MHNQVTWSVLYGWEVGWRDLGVWVGVGWSGGWLLKRMGRILRMDGWMAWINKYPHALGRQGNGACIRCLWRLLVRKDAFLWEKGGFGAYMLAFTTWINDLIWINQPHRNPSNEQKKNPRLSLHHNLLLLRISYCDWGLLLSFVIEFSFLGGVYWLGRSIDVCEILAGLHIIWGVAMIFLWWTTCPTLMLLSDQISFWLPVNIW